jgi:glycosyltransferase involved in cell wall biosynthesis
MQERYRLDEQPIVVRSCPPYQGVTRTRDSQYPFKLLYHGVYRAERGLEQLILAMHRVDHAHLYLRGFGYYEEPLRNLVSEENLQSKVSFLPPVPMIQLVEAAANFDIGVCAYQDVSLNSRYCLPNKVFEYVMAGLALAVSDLPELRRIALDYGVGVTFEQSDPKDIARQINSLLADPERLRQMQLNALNVARDALNFEHESDKLRRVIESTIGSPAVET